MSLPTKLQNLIEKWQAQAKTEFIKQPMLGGPGDVYQLCAHDLAALLIGEEPPADRDDENYGSPEEIAALRDDFERWLDGRHVPPAVRKMLLPWKDVVVSPAVEGDLIALAHTGDEAEIAAHGFTCHLSRTVLVERALRAVEGGREDALDIATVSAEVECGHYSLLSRAIRQRSMDGQGILLEELCRLVAALHGRAAPQREETKDV